MKNKSSIWKLFGIFAVIAIVLAGFMSIASASDCWCWISDELNGDECTEFTTRDPTVFFHVRWHLPHDVDNFKVSWIDPNDETITESDLVHEGWTFQLVFDEGAWIGLNCRMDIAGKERLPGQWHVEYYDDYSTPFGILKLQCSENFTIRTPPPTVHNLNTGENFSTIQAAIDDHDTKNGHMIVVDAGRYTENVKVNKSLTICSTSENPADTIVQALYSNDHVFEVTADYVNISGFTVKGAGIAEEVIYLGMAGIYLENVDHCDISYNNVSNNVDGIFLWGSNSTVLNNNCFLNHQRGIVSCGSNNSILNNNCFLNNDGIFVYESDNSTISNNNCSSNNGNGIYLCQSCFWGLCNNSVSNNNCSNNEYGIYLWDSNNNSLSNNICSSNNEYGIYLELSNNNIIYLNNFINNNSWFAQIISRF